MIGFPCGLNASFVSCDIAIIAIQSINKDVNNGFFISTQDLFLNFKPVQRLIAAITGLLQKYYKTIKLTGL